MELILNVDDYAPGRYARTKVLQQAGFSVWEAATGKEALQLVTDYRPALVLLDVNLPDMSGFDVCKQIRADPKVAATTILHISASNVQVHHQVQGLNWGADSYLLEPIDPTVLVATIRAFLRARHAEDALRRSNEELEWFGYRVAHDLSEPLRTLIAHTQYVESELGSQVTERVAESLHFVGDAAQRMRLFIDGLLRYAQDMKSGLQIGPVKCEAMLAQTIRTLDAAIQESGARITHDRLPEVAADPALEHVFQNLLSNAIKYRRHGVALEIHVSATWSSGEWQFSVRDNGAGIDPLHKDGIFQIFRRLHGREIPGTGIGLALSKKIVDAHAGRIWVESDVGAGSTFYFTLPQETPEIPTTRVPENAR